jgi:hypothetical protein
MEALAEVELGQRSVCAELMAHQSQHQSTMGIDGEASGEQAAFAHRVRDQLRAHGALAGLPQGESFHLITET